MTHQNDHGIFLHAHHEELDHRGILRLLDQMDYPRAVIISDVSLPCGTATDSLSQRCSHFLQPRHDPCDHVPHGRTAQLMSGKNESFFH